MLDRRGLWVLNRSHGVFADPGRELRVCAGAMLARVPVGCWGANHFPADRLLKTSLTLNACGMPARIRPLARAYALFHGS